MSDQFSCKSYGKWILAGEHSVLRGHPALVFPMLSAYLQFDYKKRNEPLRFEFEGPRGEELNLLAYGVLENALEKVGRQRSEIQGLAKIHSTLPVGAGLGASAALCVMVGRWFHYLGWLSKEDLYEFSRGLENLFHGESSGVDIAVALSGEGLVFSREGLREPLAAGWSPHFYLSYSGQRGVTAECVQQVKDLEVSDPKTFLAVDQKMSNAVQQAKIALEGPEDSGLDQLAQAIRSAAECFSQWGLSEGLVKNRIDALYAKGALAVKPTGSGGGGYLLSLWSQELEHPEEFGLFSCPLPLSKTVQ